MKILIVSQYYYPERFLINEVAPFLVKRGHEVTVLTGTPNYPEGKIYAGYEDGKRCEETIDGVRVVRTVVPPRGDGIVGLIKNYAGFARKASEKVKELENDYDIALCYQLSPVTMLRPAVKYAKKNGAPLLCYCLDIWPESALSHLKNKKGLIYAGVKALSNRLYKKCDTVAVTSKPFIDYLSRVNGVPENKLYYLPQHGKALETAEKIPGDKKIFLYAGNIGRAQRIDVITDAAKELSGRDDFEVWIVGDGSELENVKKAVNESGLSDKIVLHGGKTADEMTPFYNSADALLLTLRGNNEVGNTLPSKLQTYMSAGRPVLASANGAAYEIIKESGCGDAVTAENPKGLSRLMADFLDKPEAYEGCGKKGREYFRNHFTLEIFAENLENIMKETVEKHGIR